MNSTAVWDYDAPTGVAGSLPGNKEDLSELRCAYRGPLGVNFSYLENRCDLLLHPTLPESEVSEAASALLTACSKAYDDFELEEFL